MDFKKWHKNILNDVRIELKDEFDQNFERKAFFDVKWPANKLINRTGSMMMRSGNLRSSIQAKMEIDRIAFSSSLPYASIQNEGGEITVTAKMKRFFWAKYMEAGGKSGDIVAQQYKALALMPVGKKIKIPSRRFIGKHPKIRDVIQDVVNDNLHDLNALLKNQLTQK